MKHGLRSTPRLRSLLVFGVVPMTLFQPGIHKDITDEALRMISVSVGGDTFGFSDKAIEEIKTGNFKTDVSFTFFNGPAHFTEEAFTASTTRLMTIKEEVIDLITQEGKRDATKAWRKLGGGLHTLQDFYAHSNWVELGNGGINMALGRSVLADPSPTIATCPGDPTTLPPGAGPILTTAYYVGLLGCGPLPPGKCWHGGPGGCSGIAKDKPSQPNHSAARALAVLASVDYVEQILMDPRVAGDEAATKCLLGVTRGTIGFVIDDTGSMSDDIASVRAQINSIVNSMTGMEGEPKTYVLVRYGDPDVGPAQCFSDPQEFLSAVNGLSASGGGDCPELANTALIQALITVPIAGDDRTTIYLFTDASSKDGSSASAVAQLAAYKRATIRYGLTGSCSPIDPSYLALATATGGQAFRISVSDIPGFFDLIEPEFTGDLQPIARFSGTLAASTTQVTAPIDSTVSKAVFAITLEVKNSVTVLDPGGTPVTGMDPGVTVSNLLEGCIVTVDDPADGTWTVQLDGDGRYSVAVNGVTPIAFAAFDLVESVNPEHTGYRVVPGDPFSGVTPLVLAKVLGPYSTASFELTDEVGGFLQAISLSSGDPLAGTADFTGAFAVPVVPFRVQVVGQDGTGAAYQRLYPILHSPRSVDVQVDTASVPTRLTTSVQHNLVFDVTNLAPTTDFNITTSDDMTGFVTAISTTPLNVPMGAAGQVTVTLDIPAGTPSGTDFLLTVAAAATADPDLRNSTTLQLTVLDCSELSPDCNANGIPDECEIAEGNTFDCNGNLIPDECDLITGVALDCNLNGIPDSCDIATGFSLDCNLNGIPDDCDIVSGLDPDCNGNLIPDSCDIATGFSFDCNLNGVPDSCDIATGFDPDCNLNGIPDSCDIVTGFSVDCNGNAIPDSCDIATGFSIDCNSNAIPDSCDIATGLSIDCNGNAIPDECDLGTGASLDCNSNSVPDECDIASDFDPDCNGNAIPDSCDIATGFSLDCNRNGIPDECDIGSGFSSDCNQNGVPDECDPPLPHVFFVDVNATGAGNGLTWTDAFVDLQSAIDVAVTCGGFAEVQMWVAAGTYVPSPVTGDPRSATFQLFDGLAIYGGFAGGETTLGKRDFLVNVTILDGDRNGDDVGFVNNGENAYHVVTATGVGPTALLDGFTVRGGNANGPFDFSGAGLSIFGGNPTLANLRMDENMAFGGAGAHIGGGATMTLVGCTFENGVASFGAGALVDSSSPGLVGCDFQNNTALHSGGGLYVQNGSAPTVTGCSFALNSAIQLGGAAVIDGVTASFDTCTITQNSGNVNGGGFATTGGASLILSACAFSLNTTPGGGGALWNANSSTMSLSSCTLTANSADRGGAIGNVALDIDVADSMFDGNSATSSGGALDARVGASFTLEGCTFLNNSASIGGAVELIGASAALDDCSFTDNMATNSGGAMELRGSSSAQVADCTFENNSSTSGGGVACVDSTPSFTGCTFRFNTSNSGGAVSNADSNSSFISCTFTQNSATNSGGALANQGSSDTVVISCSFESNDSNNGGAVQDAASSSFYQSSTFRQNTSTDVGGAVVESQGVTTMRGCLFADNSGSNGGGIRDGGAAVLSICILWGNSDNGGMDESAQIFVSGAANPQIGFIDFSAVQGWTGALGGTANNGLDPQFINPAVGDYHLAVTSPSVDTGDPGFLALPGELDFDGEMRVIGFGVDRGADEMLDCNMNGVPDVVGIAAGLEPDCNGNNAVDACDVMNGTSSDFDGNGVPDECQLVAHDAKRP